MPSYGSAANDKQEALIRTMMVACLYLDVMDYFVASPGGECSFLH